MLSDEQIKRLAESALNADLHPMNDRTTGIIYAIKQAITEATAPLLKEIEELKHDLKRYMSIANTEATKTSEYIADAIKAERERCISVCRKVEERFDRLYEERHLVELQLQGDAANECAEEIMKGG